jgi:hypothetical protein
MDRIYCFMPLLAGVLDIRDEVGEGLAMHPLRSRWPVGSVVRMGATVFGVGRGECLAIPLFCPL